MKVQFLVMEPMERLVHRWDTCCLDWWEEVWAMEWLFLKSFNLGLFFRFLPVALQPIFGTCQWHGLNTSPEWPIEGEPQ